MSKKSKYAILEERADLPKLLKVTASLLFKVYHLAQKLTLQGVSFILDFHSYNGSRKGPRTGVGSHMLASSTGWSKVKNNF